MPEAQEKPNLAALFDASSENYQPPEQEQAPVAEAPEPQQETAPPPAEEHKAESEPPATEAAEPDDVPHVETLSELAEAIGVEVSDLYNIRLPVTSPDGTKGEVSLGEYKDAYQSSQRVQQMQREIEAKRTASDQELAQAQSKAQQTLQQTAALLNAAERQLTAEYEGVDWNRLRTEDPVEWAAKRQDFSERQNAINKAKQDAVTEAQRMQSETTEKAQKHRQEVLRREESAMLASIPEWKDEAKRSAEQAQLVDYLVKSGFDSKDVASVADHRVILLARKAMQFDQRTKEGKEAARRLVKVAPKRTLKPGAAQSKSDQEADAAKSAMDRLKKTGDIRDFAALFKRV